MIRLVYWPKPRWRVLLAGFSMVAAAIAVSAAHVIALERGNRLWVGQTWFMLYPMLFAGNIRAAALYLLTDGVLAVWTEAGVPKYIPLADVELSKKSGASLRWRERGRHRREWFNLPERVLTELEQAIQDAQGRTDLPRSAEQAAHALRIAPEIGAGYVVGAFFGQLVLLGLAIWLNQPLLMAPVVLFPLLAYKVPQRAFALIGSDLLVLEPGREPERIPLAEVTVELRGRTLLVRTQYRRFRRLRFTQPDFVRSLRFRAAGQPDPMPPLAEPRRREPAGEPVRCSLCGREVERSPVAPPPCEVTVCPACEARVRLEAQEGGHGLAGKEPKPM